MKFKMEKRKKKKIINDLHFTLLTIWTHLYRAKGQWIHAHPSVYFENVFELSDKNRNRYSVSKVAMEILYLLNFTWILHHWHRRELHTSTVVHTLSSPALAHTHVDPSTILDVWKYDLQYVVYFELWFGIHAN